MYKVIVAGSRNFTDYTLLSNVLDTILPTRKHKRITIISGTARGADQLGERYAKEKGYGILRFPADWKTYGKRAGYLRNMEMAKIADMLVAFWDGESRGTKHMIDIAEKRNLPMYVFNVGETKSIETVRKNKEK